MQWPMSACKDMAVLHDAATAVPQLSLPSCDNVLNSALLPAPAHSYSAIIIILCYIWYKKYGHALPCMQGAGNAGHASVS